MRQATFKGHLAIPCALLALPAVVWFFDIPLPVLIPGSHVLSFHIVVELFAVLVALVVFTTGFHVLRQNEDQTAGLVLASGFLGVAVLDLLHLLTFPGMPELVGEFSAHQTIIFWLAARLTAAAALLAYSVLTVVPGLRRRILIPRRPLFLASLALLAGISAIGLWRPGWIPSTFSPEDGLTPFKIALEWAVVCIHGATLLVLFAFGRPRRQQRMVLLSSALILLIASEFFFTLYVNLRDTFFVLGHVYKVLAYLCIYHCIFIESVRNPIDRLDAANRALAQKERSFQAMVDTAPDGVVVTDSSGAILLVNRNTERLFGHSAAQLLGKPISTILPHGAAIRTFGGSERRWHNQGAVPGRRRDGAEFPVDITRNRYRDDNGERITTFIRDATERTRQEAALHHQATHDDLTGLANRWLFLHQLSMELHKLATNGDRVAVLLLDLDQFKLVNDRFGHLVGDELLQCVADRLRSAVRTDDLVARLGGDEFAVLLTDLTDRESVAGVGNAILDCLSTPIVLSCGHGFTPTASVGISIGPDHGTDSTDLIRYADLAMYTAKAEARGGCLFFSAELDQRLQQELLLLDRLRHAIADNQLSLYYQPQLDTAENRITAVEALLRWNDPEYGAVPPDDFIPLAERNGLMPGIDEWVLRTACAQIAEWHAAGVNLRVAVNLSAPQFSHACLAERVSAALTDTGAPAELLEIEITESTAMQAPELAARQIALLRALGVSTALDDFGTGHSSLAKLRDLPVAKLKLDRAFIAGILDRHQDEVVLRTVAALGNSLGLKVIAEGVESEAQRALIARHGCHGWQGWLAWPALPATDIRPLLEVARAGKATLDG